MPCARAGALIQRCRSHPLLTLLGRPHPHPRSPGLHVAHDPFFPLLIRPTQTYLQHLKFHLRQLRILFLDDVAKSSTKTKSLPIRLLADPRKIDYYSLLERSQTKNTLFKMNLDLDVEGLYVGSAVTRMSLGANAFRSFFIAMLIARPTFSNTTTCLDCYGSHTWSQ